ncbi:MAG: PAS domain-containing protein [Sulfitobacter sp.]|nr:PAS domain-containing protein [Sulfitobacter sp.]
MDLAVEIMAYVPDGKQKNGVVFTLQGIAALREAIERAEGIQRVAEERMNEVEQIYRTSPLAMGLMDCDMLYIRLNEKMAEISGERLERHIGAPIRDIIPAVAEQTEELIRTLFETKKPIQGQRVIGTIKSRSDDPRLWESVYEKLTCRIEGLSRIHALLA